ncbi:MAG TPA: peptidase M13, partial [Mycobacterium sp.]|nr:peptidase M13 [Mycobacterium sp.]
MTVASNPSGLDLRYVDVARRPQDDLFGHVNGRWLDSYEMPADRATDGAFRTLYDRAEEQVRELIDEAAAANAPAGTDQQRIGDLYASFSDADAVERRGLAPLLDELALIDAAADADALAATLGALARTGVGGGFGVYVDTDSKDSTRYLLHLSQSGLGLPDRDYYFDQSERGKKVLADYRAFVTRMFELSGTADPGAAADRVLTLERSLAKPQWTRVE